jgi:hypothetical protein
MIVFDMAADETFEAMLADLVLIRNSGLSRPAVQRFHARARRGYRRRRHEIGPSDSQRLHDLSAQCEAHRVAARDFQMF